MNIIREYTAKVPIHGRKPFLEGIVVPGRDGIHHRFLGLTFEAKASQLYSEIEGKATGTFFEHVTTCYFCYAFTEETFTLQVYGTDNWAKTSNMLRQWLTVGGA